MTEEAFIYEYKPDIPEPKYYLHKIVTVHVDPHGEKMEGDYYFEVTKGDEEFPYPEPLSYEMDPEGNEIPIYEPEDGYDFDTQYHATFQRPQTVEISRQEYEKAEAIIQALSELNSKF